MCGISGIISLTKDKIVFDEIKDMTDLITHRGPDDEGFFLGDDFAFGHRRLSIIDLSSDGHQPMHYLGGRYTIVFNGEIYNYIEIRNELCNKGYVFNSNTDTEVILASYDKWGENCVDKFNGMWAFALYDKEKDIVFCSRDRFGVKPFYYAEINGKFIFGSEIKQLIHFQEKIIANKKILMDYLIIGYEEHTNETFFKDVFKLQSSHNLVFNLKSRQYSIFRYYDIKKKIKQLSENQALDLFSTELERSVRYRLRSDVQIGACLSGGLDSSTIVAVASSKNNKQSGKKMVAIHAKSSEVYSDESKFAIDVAKHCNLQLDILEPTYDDFKNNLDKVILTQEEPFGGPSIFMQYAVMAEAKKLNCKIMLDGQGGDETLLGYERYFVAFLKGMKPMCFVKSFHSAVKNSSLTSIKLFLFYFYFSIDKIRFYLLKRKFNFIKDNYVALIDKDLLNYSSKGVTDIFQLQHLEIFKLQMPHLLKYEDKNSMINSIEARLPFVDYQLLEFSLSLPKNLKIKNGWTKYILRKSMKEYLPKKIVWRKNKLGFEAPTETWLKQLESEMVDAIKESLIIKEVCKSNTSINLHSLGKSQKWRLFNIAKWEKAYNVKIN